MLASYSSGGVPFSSIYFVGQRRFQLGRFVLLLIVDYCFSISVEHIRRTTLGGFVGSTPKSGRLLGKQRRASEVLGHRTRRILHEPRSLDLALFEGLERTH